MKVTVCTAEDYVPNGRHIMLCRCSTKVPTLDVSEHYVRCTRPFVVEGEDIKAVSDYLKSTDFAVKWQALVKRQQNSAVVWDCVYLVKDYIKEVDVLRRGRIYKPV